MTKTYFVSYWDREYNHVSNTHVEIIVPESSTQGVIASLIMYKLSVNCRLINFWEI